jgi:hypothetical protein
LIGVQKIEEIIDGKGKKKVTCVNVLCKNTLFIDKDLKFPGVSFFILSENWKILGKRKIDLKGADG